MHNNKNKYSVLVALWLPTAVLAAPMNDFQFKSPAFSGIGYSSHVLTIENQEYTRQKAAADKIQAAIDKAAADAKNSNLQKFLNNLESRIYAQISQNLATAMFASGGSNSGTLNFEGNTIFWTKETDDVGIDVDSSTRKQSSRRARKGHH